MSRSLVTVTADTPLSEARARLATGHVHHLPVVDEDRLVGIVSATDFVHAAQSWLDPGKRPRRDAVDRPLTVADIMQRDPITVGPETKLGEVMDLLADGGFHSLPVVQGGKLIGIVTTTDIVRRFRAALVDAAEGGAALACETIRRRIC
jgi:CBS domain-containing protein